MNLNIIQVGSKALLIGAISIVFIGCGGNMAPPPPKQMSQLEWRELQSKQFDTDNKMLVMRAIVAALQDEGYTIQSSNNDLGLITGVLEINELDSSNKNAQEFWYGQASGYQTSKRINVSTTTTVINGRTRVRINMTAKGLSESGGTLWSQPVQQQKPYQDIFQKVDKSIFLQKEKL